MLLNSQVSCYAEITAINLYFSVIVVCAHYRIYELLATGLLIKPQLFVHNSWQLVIKSEQGMTATITGILD